MKTQKPEKREQKRPKGTFFDYEEIPRKSKAKKPKRGRKEDFSYYDRIDEPEEDDFEPDYH